MPRSFAIFLLVFVIACSIRHVAAAEAATNTDPSAIVVFYLAIILIAAKLGGELAERIGQPAVLGELLAGIALGNSGLAGFQFFEPMKTDQFVDVFARIGAVILLFEVGLASTIAQMKRVGLSSFLVASLGVVASFALGYLVSALLLPGQTVYAHVFLGATICATSVGITARVLQDIGRSQSNEARIILGAAVIDDVMGLAILAVVGGAISGAAKTGGTANVSYVSIAILLGKAAAFLLGSLTIGALVSPRLFRAAARFKVRGALLATGLSCCFILAWLSSVIGLAPIIGAFAAGLILEEFHFQDFIGRGEHSLGELIEPISQFLAPVFFVLMGMRADLSSFTQPGVLGLAVAITAAAIIAKQFCGLGVIGRDVNRLAIGIGMIPRGEVELIFASAGMGLSIAGRPVIDKSTYSALVIMVVVTTMITPPLLKWSLRKSSDELRVTSDE